MKKNTKKRNKNLPPEPEPLTPENIGDETVDELPEPSGYRILVLPFTPKTKSAWWNIIFTRNFR